MPPDGKKCTGRCYCGAIEIETDEPPLTVVFCHCGDCRRLTGAPVAAFAAFSEGTANLFPNPDTAKPVNPGVTRRFCPDCGTPLWAEFDYLPGQIFVPLEVLDQAFGLPPEIHCHVENRLPWLHIEDAAERVEGSARQTIGVHR